MKKVILIKLLVASVWGLLTLVGANPAMADQAQVAEGYKYYQISSQDGGSGNTKKAIKLFTKAVDEDPQDPLANVLLGASYALKGRDALMPWTKMKSTEKGLAIMSDSIEMLSDEDEKRLFERLPVHIQVKSQAGIVFTSVPDFFNRFDQGRELLEETLVDIKRTQLPAIATKHIYFYAAIAAEKDEDMLRAKELYQHVVNVSPDDEYGQTASEKLNSI